MADADTSPEFDHWGTELEEPVERPERGPPLRGVSPLRLAGIAAVIAALVALIVSLAGGGSRSPAAAESPRAIAAAVNLSLADVRGFRIGSTAGVSVGGSPDASFARCLGASAPLAAPPTFSSPDFVSGAGLQFVSLESTVSFTTRSALAQEAAAAASPRFAGCVADALASLTYRAHGLAITSGGGAQATPLSLPPSKVARSVFASRASLTWSVNGLNFPVFVDLYVAGVGRDAVGLFVLSTEQPYSVATEDRLVSLLETRAALHPH